MKIHSDEWLFEHTKYDPLKDKWVVRESQRTTRGLKFAISCEVCGDSFLYREKEGPYAGRICSRKCLYDHPGRKRMLSEKAKKQWQEGELLEPVRRASKRPERCKKISESKIGDKHPRYAGHRAFLLYEVYGHYLPQDERRPEPDTLFRSKQILQVKCKKCGVWFRPEYFQVWRRIYALDGKRKGEANFYCSKECTLSCNVYGTSLYPRGLSPHGSKVRNPDWRDMVQACAEGLCEICGKEGKVAHHIIPLINNQLLSADLDNGLWLCEDCHKDIVHKLPGCKFNELAGKLCK
jgi:hypothetical protein